MLNSLHDFPILRLKVEYGTRTNCAKREETQASPPFKLIELILIEMIGSNRLYGTVNGRSPCTGKIPVGLVTSDGWARNMKRT